MILEQDPSLRSYIEFTGSTPHVDSIRQNFVLEKVLINPKIPLWTQSFYFYFDIISQLNNPGINKNLRFNIAQFDLYANDSQSTNILNLFSINIDIQFRSFFIGTDIQTNTKLFGGELKLISNYNVNGGSNQVSEVTFNIDISGNEQDLTILNKNNFCYKTNQMAKYQMESILSPQMLILSVKYQNTF